MIKKDKFELVCKEICTEDWYNREDYLSIKKNKILTHFLKLPLQKIAQYYFPHSPKGVKLAFPAVIVRRIATKLEVFVTDIVRY